VDLSRGLSAAEVHWHAVRCRWWSVAAAGCFHPSASPGEYLGSSSQWRSSRELGKVGIGRSVGRKLSRLWCRRQHRRRLRASWPSLEAVCWDASCFGLCLPCGNISSILRRSDDGSIGAVSFLRASLWKSWAFVACGAVSLWRWKIGRSFRSLVFFFLYRSGCILLFPFYLGVRFRA
jgi:hypothetical protein